MTLVIHLQPIDLFVLLFEMFWWFLNLIVIFHPPILYFLLVNLIIRARIVVTKININLILSLKASSQTKGLLILIAKINIIERFLNEKFILCIDILCIDVQLFMRNQRLKLYIILYIRICICKTNFLINGPL